MDDDDHEEDADARGGDLEAESTPRGSGELDVADPASSEVRVLAEKCFDCILGPADQRLFITPEHIREPIADARAREGHIVCHNTYPPLCAESGRAAICRGFYDAYGRENIMLRLAHALGVMVEVPAPDPAGLPARRVGRETRLTTRRSPTATTDGE